MQKTNPFVNERYFFSKIVQCLWMKNMLPLMEPRQSFLEGFSTKNITFLIPTCIFTCIFAKMDVKTVQGKTKSLSLKSYPGYFYWQVLCPAGTRLKLFLRVWKEQDGARRDHHQMITRSPHFHSLENFNINLKLYYTPFLKFLPITLRRPGWKLFLKKKISIFDNVLEKIKSKIFEIK